MADGSNSPAYEQFCLLAKAQRGRAIVALIEQVLNKDKIYVFGELLAMDNVQALAGTEFENHLRLLEIFAFGTYSQYMAESEKLPQISNKMVVKLRQLSIVSLAHQSKKVPYATLLTELSLSNVRELEDLIIDTIYAGILEGKLDQAKGVFNVKHAMARDVRPQDVRLMIEKLTALQNKLTELGGNIDSNMNSVKESRSIEELLRAAVIAETVSLKGVPSGGSASTSSRAKTHQKASR
mmetsp:Transcript_28334/g.33570  ORF Transcript_28334/g.33570 Transcript_28334/m.33570 type:complete len:238 (+) Transcript_28334:16-729(+)